MSLGQRKQNTITIGGSGNNLIIHESGRFYLYDDEEWACMSNISYGFNERQWSNGSGYGAAPTPSWQDLGWLVPPNRTVKKLYLMGRVNNAQATDMYVSLMKVVPNPVTRWGSGFDADSEITSTELHNDTFQNMVTNFTGTTYAGNMQDMHLAGVDLDHEITEYSQLFLYVKPIEELTSNRFFYCSMAIELE